ncbi:scavenger receptor class F member 1 isoform X2 [Cavia porcellus]|uniref:scavenger receptor class F member 1 isoform X2 n=1 Tax=Cavia porcellus TaxID=10141 RepID=UPI000661C692|nr:scavenger receptor class F member 1 isoform X2 [Cavia porcellus]
MGLELLLPLLLLWTQETQESELDPKGQNVCRGSSPLAKLVCCPGWKQKDGDCTVPVCEGLDACRKDEVCVKPGFCRCKPGFFGAQCSSSCPDQYWGPDCRETCACYPHGKCDPATGVCQCHAGRWGDNCESQCSCGPHGHCNPKTGQCRCDPGWWSATCRRQCQCNPAARCDPDTGNCLCPLGMWGRRCNFRCHCHNSPCAPDTGRCMCQAGWLEPDCKRPCAPGYYGLQCRQRCGHCKHNAPCSVDTGSCESCEPGWNGTRCQQPCSPGTFGENCSQQCPHCRDGEPCQIETGDCEHCDPGRLGPSCNSSCLSGSYGNNCSLPCQCSDGLCDPVSGACLWGRKKSLLIGSILGPLLLLLLGIACCAYCHCATSREPKDRPARGGTALSRMKQQFWGALSSLGSVLPCGSLSGYKLPWVTVSHHDPEVPFNHSFIEQPSAGWASEDSFSSDSESGAENENSAYCVSSPKGMVPVAPAELSPRESSEATFPPPEDASTPFPIPRTSSLARAKRPSVSFAEGTKFVSQSGRSSGELHSPARKPKRLSRGAQPGPEGRETEESTSLEQAKMDKAPTAAARSGNSANGHQAPCGSQKVAKPGETTEGSMQESSDSAASIYMLVGMPEKSKGPVRSVLRRLGNFQKGQEEPKVKSAIPKPPRRALGQKKGSSGMVSGSASQSPGLAPSANAAGAVEPVGVKPEEVSRGLGDGRESPGRPQEPISSSSLPEQDPQKHVEEEEQEEPLYENVHTSGWPES